MGPTSCCSILVLQGPTRNPRGFLSAWAAFDFFCEAPGELLCSSSEAGPPHPSFEYG